MQYHCKNLWDNVDSVPKKCSNFYLICHSFLVELDLGINFFFPSSLKLKAVPISSSQLCGLFLWVSPLFPGPSSSQKSQQESGQRKNKNLHSLLQESSSSSLAFTQTCVQTFSTLGMKKAKEEALCLPSESVWGGQNVSSRLNNAHPPPKISPRQMNLCRDN